MCGYFIHLDKSELEPKQQLTFLGFHFDSVRQEVSVPYAKYEKAVEEINHFLESSEDVFSLNYIQRIRVCRLYIITTFYRFSRK